MRAPNPQPFRQMPPQPAGGATQITPISPAPNSFGGKVAAEFAGKVDQSSARLMIMATVTFFIVFFLIAASIVIKEIRNTNIKAQESLFTNTQSVAQDVSGALDQSILWVERGLAEGKSAGESARMITASPNITGSVIIDSSNRIIAASPQNAGALAAIGADPNAPDIRITSLIEDGGKVTPVIVKKTGLYFVIAALDKNALIGIAPPNGSKLALIAPSGRIISANADFGDKGPLELFDLSTDQLSTFTRPAAQLAVKHKVEGRQGHLVSIGVPNSDLVVMQARPRPKTSIFSTDLPALVIIFLATCILVGMFINAVLKQLRSMIAIQRDTEVSQQRFQAAAEGDRGGVWEIDLAADRAYLSASLSGVLGLNHQENYFQVAQFLNLFHPADREQFIALIRRSHIQGEFELDIRVAHLPMIMQCRGRPSTRSGPELKRVIVGVALDITEQRGAQTRLQAAESRLSDALRSMSDSFVVWDGNRRLVQWNVRFEDFFGFKPGDLYPGLDYATVEYMKSAAIAERIPTQSPDGSIELRLQDGRWLRYIESQTREGGQVSIGTNITEIRARESELRENEKALRNTVDILRKSQDGIFELAARYEEEKIRAEEANQSKSDFLANMSHELRTPLNAINGFSDIMKKEMFGPLGDPRYKEYVSDILFSGQHLLALINDILDMSKIEAGKMTLNTEVMYMHEMLAQVGRIVRGRAEEAQLNLEITTDEVREINADPRAVKQVLLNLLTNAIKFTPEDGTVKAELIEKKSGIIVKVSDSGIGISQENIERLAKPFEQVVDGETKHKEGTGLGLALSKSLIELHGGNFKIESVLGEGTTVIFSLPNQPAPQKEDVPRNQVSQEISRLAQDIATVLSENSDPANAADAQANVAEHFVERAHSAPTETGGVHDANHDDRGAA